ncbi:DNA replication and repair protein RecF [Gottschalkia purinilytica]|uniref:DNA replication and repair protein RecF n=1 Tax=Gottschalkia purinilytica TaxID=1503 RepID=A0A0L0W743_GOTPU|nr:DNA replication/repair protein RecF [Gottschalkia purinilytica]KNF07301.1 DNA replication and repair protein RecF [Gottschalkia purinilytica]
MYVKSIRLINFRNYDNLKIELNKKINIFLGDNAQGKTNLLESIYICSSGKSYRSSKDKEIINIKKDKAYVGIEVEKDNFNKYIEIKFEKDKPKRIRINKIELDRVSELIGNLNVVIFSPEDLKLVKEGPLERRTFLDTEISQIKPKYKYNLNKYNKILIQRNKLLKSSQFDNNNLKTIDIWNEQLSNIGSEIIISRTNFLRTLSKISKEIHKKLTGSNEELEVRYVPSFNIKDINKDKLKEQFKEILNKNIEKDIEKGTTEYGPHRDDIDIIINNMPCRIYGSQGQQRTAALSLKLAEVELINMEVGEYPVLLLDDVLSELDINRRKYLLSTFKDIQTIITSTDDIDLDDIEDISKSTFYIKQGNVLY